ncbi:MULTISPECIES: hypothetical protein [Bacteria]
MSRNYLHERATLKKPLTLNDVEVLCQAMGLGDPTAFMVEAAKAAR